MVKIFILNCQDLMINGQDFPTGWSRLHVEWSRFFCWTVEISWWMLQIFILNSQDFMLNGWDFPSKRLRFYTERSRFSWWTVKIFMLNGQDFHDERSRFEQWQVMAVWDFHNSRSRIALLLLLKSRSARRASGNLAFSFHLPVSLIYLLHEFLFLLLKQLNEMWTGYI